MIKPLALSLLLLAVPVDRCAAYEFGVDGEITVTYYRQGQLLRKGNYDFTIEVEDASSRIRVFGGMWNLVEFIEYGWDKTNSHLLIKFLADRTTKTVWRAEGGNVTSVALDKPAKAQNEATLKLYKADELPQSNYGLEPVWLAYASAHYFQARKSGDKIEAVWNLASGERESRILLTSVWRLNADTPRLLESMSDFADGKRYDTTGSRVVVGQMPKPFDSEYTNSIYETLSWTNVADVSVPYRFRVTRYVPDFNAVSQPSLLLSQVYEGTVKQMRSMSASKTFAANIPGGVPSQILDKRFATVGGPVGMVSYFSPTGAIMSMEEAKKSHAYKQALGDPEPKVSSEKSRSLLIVIFLISLVFPVWILAKRKT